MCFLLHPRNLEAQAGEDTGFSGRVPYGLQLMAKECGLFGAAIQNFQKIGQDADLLAEKTTATSWPTDSAAGSILKARDSARITPI